MCTGWVCGRLVQCLQRPEALVLWSWSDFGCELPTQMLEPDLGPLELLPAGLSQ